MRQQPFAFEYNEHYLKYLAYHSTSAFSVDFLLDCEADRKEQFLYSRVNGLHLLNMVF